MSYLVLVALVVIVWGGTTFSRWWSKMRQWSMLFSSDQLPFRKGVSTSPTSAKGTMGSQHLRPSVFRMTGSAIDGFCRKEGPLLRCWLVGLSWKKCPGFCPHLADSDHVKKNSQKVVWKTQKSESLKTFCTRTSQRSDSCLRYRSFLEAAIITKWRISLYTKLCQANRCSSTQLNCIFYLLRHRTGQQERIFSVINIWTGQWSATACKGYCDRSLITKRLKWPFRPPAEKASRDEIAVYSVIKRSWQWKNMSFLEDSSVKNGLTGLTDPLQYDSFRFTSKSSFRNTSTVQCHRCNLSNVKGSCRLSNPKATILALAIHDSPDTSARMRVLWSQRPSPWEKLLCCGRHDILQWCYKFGSGA